MLKNEMTRRKLLATLKKLPWDTRDWEYLIQSCYFEKNKEGKMMVLENIKLNPTWVWDFELEPKVRDALEKRNFATPKLKEVEIAEFINFFHFFVHVVEYLKKNSAPLLLLQCTLCALFQWIAGNKHFVHLPRLRKLFYNVHNILTENIENRATNFSARAVFMQSHRRIFGAQSCFQGPCLTDDPKMDMNMPWEYHLFGFIQEKNFILRWLDVIYVLQEKITENYQDWCRLLLKEYFEHALPLSDEWRNEILEQMEKENDVEIFYHWTACFDDDENRKKIEKMYKSKFL
jgi:hypothetical protein